MLKRTVNRLFRRLRNEDGVAIVEFGISAPFLVLMSIGVFVVGMMVDRHLTLSQVVRNAGNMYARGIDFSSSQNKNFIVDAARGLDLQLSGGSSAVYLSRLTRVPANAVCDTGGGPRPCNNNGQVVVTQRYMIGDTGGSGMYSRLGMPTQFKDPAGNPSSEGDHVDFFDLTDAVATGAPASLTGSGGLAENELIYVVEVIHRPVSLSFPGIVSPDMMYSRGFF